jgi:soluble lytic murein transglycosylase-like protein
MVKQNVKKFGYILVSLFFIGITGLFLSLGQLNARYENKGRVLEVLSNHVLKLKNQVDVNKQKIADYDFMRYKSIAFSSRYPEFSYILDTVYQKSSQFGFKPNLVLGIIKVESDYNPRAVSYKGAYGLMQVNMGVWRNELNLDERRIFDVAYNLDKGLKILKKYYDLTRGNLARALHLYNNGYLYNNTSYIAKVDSAMIKISTPSSVAPGASMEPMGL